MVKVALVGTVISQVKAYEMRGHLVEARAKIRRLEKAQSKLLGMLDPLRTWHKRVTDPTEEFAHYMNGEAHTRPGKKRDGKDGWDDLDAIMAPILKAMGGER